MLERCYPSQIWASDKMKQPLFLPRFLAVHRANLFPILTRLAINYVGCDVQIYFLGASLITNEELRNRPKQISVYYGRNFDIYVINVAKQCGDVGFKKYLGLTSPAVNMASFTWQ